jgi:hypothetical protein
VTGENAFPGIVHVRPGGSNIYKFHFDLEQIDKGLVSAGEIIRVLMMLRLQGRICFAVCLHSLTTDASTCASVLADSVVNYGALRAVFALVCASLYWHYALARIHVCGLSSCVS